MVLDIIYSVPPVQPLPLTFTQQTLPSRDLEIRRYGLTPVHEDEDPQIDVVLAHGLNGHPRLTWQAANDVFWPADLLPSILKADKIPARILVYGWNANVFDFHGNNATTDMVHHHAQTLIANLVANRRVYSLIHAVLKPSLRTC